MHKQVMTQHIFVSGSGGCGQLTIVCEELSSCKDELELQFMAKKLDKMDWFGSSDPFLQFSRSNESGKFAGNAPLPLYAQPSMHHFLCTQNYIVQSIIQVMTVQWWLEYRTHWNTERFEVLISNGSDFQWSGIAMYVTEGKVEASPSVPNIVASPY